MKSKDALDKSIETIDKATIKGHYVAANIKGKNRNDCERKADNKVSSILK